MSYTVVGQDGLTFRITSNNGVTDSQVDWRWPQTKATREIADDESGRVYRKIASELIGFSAGRSKAKEECDLCHFESFLSLPPLPARSANPSGRRNMGIRLLSILAVTIHHAGYVCGEFGREKSGESCSLTTPAISPIRIRRPVRFSFMRMNAPRLSMNQFFRWI
jgi:hypothetical protein